eukprot:s1166_g13.t1
MERVSDIFRKMHSGRQLSGKQAALAKVLQHVRELGKFHLVQGDKSPFAGGLDLIRFHNRARSGCCGAALR